MTSNDAARVGILMGSDSDWPVMTKAVEVLRELGVAAEVRVLSAHRTPKETAEYASKAASRGLEVVIAGAGAAAHLAGVIAAHTLLPVIGVPLASGPLNGFDALLATVQMPGGIPVATVGIGRADNAALLAAQILAGRDDSLSQKLQEHRERTRLRVSKADQDLQDRTRFKTF